MSRPLRAAWRRYRALPGGARLAVTAAVVVVLVVAAAAGGSGSGSGSRTGVRSAPSASPVEASTTTTSPTASPATSAPAPAVTTPVTTAATASSESPGTCRVRGSGLYVLPDPACTPGVTNPDVTQADIGTTICASGWTATIRPPESYTEPLKMEQLAAYGETGPVSSFEEDHLISLELGGSPADPRNLWPEPGASPNPKDRVENAARSAVCDGRLSLAAAQSAIAADWIALGQQLGVVSGAAPAPVPGPVTTVPAPAPPTTAASGCSPRTASGNCYRAGEYCSSADHGMTGTDAGGNQIRCEDVDGTWRWE